MVVGKGRHHCLIFSAKRAFEKHQITSNCALITTHVSVNIKLESHRVRVKVRELVRELDLELESKDTVSFKRAHDLKSFFKIIIMFLIF